MVGLQHLLAVALLLLAALGHSSLIDVEEGDKGELDAENRVKINEYFHGLVQEGIQCLATETSIRLAYVLSNLGDVNWARLICEIDVILEYSQKVQLERDIR